MENSETKVPTFDQIPLMMANLLKDNKILANKIDILYRIIDMPVPKEKDDANERMDITAAQKYIPSHPATQTIYGWTSNGQIPFHKIGKRIYFVKSELDEWLSHGLHKSDDNLRREAEEYVKKHNK